MKITEDNSIVVPRGIRYIGLWEDFELFDFPYILDKQIPGCGFTEYCITSPEFNTILCSPRKILLENKHDQHPGDTFLVVNEYDPSPGIDRDIAGKKPDLSFKVDEQEKEKASEEDKTKVYSKIRIDLCEYIERMGREGKPIKILVTYDSFRIVKGILQIFNNFDQYRVIIDEFQSIFTDSRFKASTELEFVTELQDVQKVCYVSATPMMKDYLCQVDEFKDLPYYELDWSTEDPGRIIKPVIHTRTCQSSDEAGKMVILPYLDGDFETAILEDGSKLQSKEAVLFVNSVNNICSIIKKTGLKPEQCNILVANTSANLKKIQRRLGKKFAIGKVPLRNEPRKMFTFCTRTVYLGADFYSDNARSFIISDANVQTLAVDISLDLPQILGRQRLGENPWRNEASFYFRSLTKKNREEIGKTDFDEIVEEKVKKTNFLIDAYNTASYNPQLALIDKYARDIDNSVYKFDYVAINKNLEKGSGKIPVLNKLVLISERRAYDIQGIDYKNRFSVFSAIDAQFNTSEINDELNAKNFYEDYEKCGGNISARLKYICELGLSDEAFSRVLCIVDSKTRSYLNLGKDILRASGYNTTDINKVIHDKEVNLDDVIYSEFKEGDKLITAEMRKKLQKIYDEHNMRSRKAQAKDMNNWFEMKTGKFKDQEGNWKNGFELTKKIK